MGFLLRRSKLNPSVLEDFLLKCYTAGFEDRKATFHGDPQLQRDARMLYDEMQDNLHRLSGSDRAPSTCLTRLGRLAFGVGALQWKADTSNESMEDLQKNNLDLMTLEIDWLREKGYLPKNAEVKLSFPGKQQQA